MQAQKATEVPNLFSVWDKPSAYTLFGSKLSYFTRKLHAGLLWSPGIQFEWYEKSIHLKEDLEKRSGSPQMPVLLTPENWMIG